MKYFPYVIVDDELITEAKEEEEEEKDRERSKIFGILINYFSVRKILLEA